MKNRNLKKTFVLTLSALALASSSPSLASEITIPLQLPDKITPEFATKYIYTENGPFTDELKFPTYTWMPKDQGPRCIILAIHGLTLHGRRYRTIARTFSVNGVGLVSFDMRGFGICRTDDKNEFSTKEDDRKKVNHAKSYEDLVKLAQLVRKTYPGVPIVVLGESLGCTFCVKLAAEHNELVEGMILSAPAVKVNPQMYLSPGEIGQGLKAVFAPHHQLNLKTFITKLVSQREEVCQEMLDDPLIVKELSLGVLLGTDEFVETTAKLGKGIHTKLPILIIQGGGDACVAPKSVTDLMMAIPSTDQTLRWLGHFGHLQLETSYVRSAVIDALGDWLHNHTPEGKMSLQTLEKAIQDSGGTLVMDDAPISK